MSEDEIELEGTWQEEAEIVQRQIEFLARRVGRLTVAVAMLAVGSAWLFVTLCILMGRSH